MSYATRKSFKSQLRDRPKHSENLQSLRNGQNPKKGGGGGRFTWGKPGDELKGGVPEEEDESKNVRFESYEHVYSPPVQSRNLFVSSVADYNKFKSAVKTSLDEFLNSEDKLEFSTCVLELELPIYMQDLVYCIVKFGLDRTFEERNKLCSLISFLFRQRYLTEPQVASSIRKLYNQLSELQIDCPSALVLIREFADYLVGVGELSKSVEVECESTIQKLSDAAEVKALKEKCGRLFNEFFVSEDGDDLAHSIIELHCEELHSEVVKKMISLALDKGNHERELTCRFIAAYTGYIFKHESVERALSVLIERVEDLYLDVPDILSLLSCLIARMIIDEAVAPSFLSRQDISDRDLGVQVLTHATELISQPNASDILMDVWYRTPEDRSDK